jgi:hypothetical protein
MHTSPKNRFIVASTRSGSQSYGKRKLCFRTWLQEIPNTINPSLASTPPRTPMKVFDYEYLTSPAKAELVAFLLDTIVQTQSPMTPPFHCGVAWASEVNLMVARAFARCRLVLSVRSVDSSTFTGTFRFSLLYNRSNTESVDDATVLSSTFPRLLTRFFLRMGGDTYASRRSRDAAADAKSAWYASRLDKLRNPLIRDTLPLLGISFLYNR